MKYLLGLLVVVLFFQCSPKTAPVVAEPSEEVVFEDLPLDDEPIMEEHIVEEEEIVEEPRLVLSIKQTPCFGKCPVFTAKVFHNGDVIYNGERFTEIKGEQYGKLPVDQVEDLLKKAEFIRFFELASHYPENTDATIADLPSTIIVIVDGDYKKRVEIVHDAPKSLMDYKKYLINLLDNTAYSEEPPID